MFSEHAREMLYMAMLAGIDINLSPSQGYFNFRVIAYNDGLKNFFEQLFTSFNQFEVDETYFKNRQELGIRQFQNALKDEPYRRVGLYFGQAMYGYDATETTLKILQSITFQEFLDFKAKFFKRLGFEWLVAGHIEEAEALELCRTARDRLCDSSKLIGQDDIQDTNQLVELPK